MRIGKVITTWQAASGMLLLAAALSACTGSTGAQGPAGSAGATGPVGPTGPTGPIAALEISTASSITATITSVTVPTAAPVQPVVTFQLTDQIGEPLKGLTAGEIYLTVAKLVPPGTQLKAVPPQTSAPSPLPSYQWQSYIYTSASPAPTSAGTTTDPVVGTAAQPQATVEAGTAGKFVDNGDGTYRYTFSKDISSDPAVTYTSSLTHRVGFEIRGVTNASGSTIAANSPVYTFQPSSGATSGITQYDLVDDTTCKNCHQVLAWHGGARTEIQYCVMCHNPSSIDPSSGNTLDFKVMFHKIHMGENLPTVSGKSLTGAAVTPLANYYIFGYENSINDYSTVAYPQSDASGNNTTVSGTGQRFCVTCHNASDANTPQTGDYATAPSAEACGSCHDDINFATGVGHNNQVANDTQCVTCHGPSSTITTPTGVQVAVVPAHQTPVDTAIATFEYNILSVTNTAPGQLPLATIKVTDPTNNNAAYDITNPTGPFQQASSALNLDIAWNTIDINNIGSQSTGTANQPVTINFKAGGPGLVKNPDGSFTLQATTPIPATGTTGSGIASLEGRAVVTLPNISGSGTTATTLGVQGVSLGFAITDPTPVARTAIVDINKCNVCHRVLTLHGENRTGDINLCASCHNPNATDISQHTSTSPASPCYSGNAATSDNPIDFKRLIHEIHASGDPYSWGATGGVTICSFGGKATTFQVLYPGDANGSLANCQACHNAGTYYPVDPTVIQGTTIHSNNITTLADDVAISPNASACSGCHNDSTAQQHMIQNGALFNAGKTATGVLTAAPGSTTPPATTETCSVCHGSGAIADVAVVHNLASFQ